eukprot:1156083-Pelagomonas_calceolata.AAC.4
MKCSRLRSWYNLRAKSPPPALAAPYSLGECLRDLLDFAARMLAIGGRLVLFIPATPETYIEEEIPRHPTLKLIYNS